MKTSVKILTGIVLTIAIIGAGFAAGYYFNIYKPQTANTTTTEMVGKAEANNNTYVTSPPSRADALKLYPIDIQPVGNTSFIILPIEKAADIKTGQKILLYGKDGKLLDILGEITAVTEGQDIMKGFATVHLIMKETATTRATTVAKGNIVLHRYDDAERLPLSALVTDAAGAPHVWEVSLDENGIATAYDKTADIAVVNDDFFVLNRNASSGNIFITNPDDKLKDGQNVNTREEAYSATAQNDEVRILTVADMKLKERIEARRLAMTANGTLSNGCDPSPQTTADFINSIKEIAPGPSSRPDMAQP